MANAGTAPTPEPYRPLLYCENCSQMRRHARSGSEGRTEVHFEPMMEPRTLGGEVTVELWQCVSCDTERAWGLVY
jgi:hypothetical protein